MKSLIKISSGLPNPNFSSNNVSDITEDSKGYLYAIVGDYKSIYKSADSTITSITKPLINDRDDILVYPNPFKKSFCIKNINKQVFTETTVSLYDLAGNILDVTIMQQNKDCLKVVPKSLIPDGIYFIVVKSGDDKYYHKVVKY